MFDKGGGDYGYDGISWRQRNFMCNFCKKEYKSAQALGGHMNVHRRDRARLRLSSPSHLDHQPNPNPNPNPNIFSSPPSNSSLLCLPPYNKLTTFHSSLFPLSSSPSSLTINNHNNEVEQQENIMFPPFIPRNFLGDHVRMNLNLNMEGSHVANGFNNGNISFADQEIKGSSRVWKRRESCMVELMEMDLLKDHHGKINNEMGLGLDLELRLGRP